jgi:hypothetical protein
VWQELGNDDAWTVSEHRLADVVDALNGANWQRAGGEGPKPERVKRPHDLKEELDKSRSVQARAAAFKAKQQKR